jgi:hypothetical protein
MPRQRIWPQALDTSARLPAVRPSGRMTVVWVAHLTSTVRLSAGAVEPATVMP